MRGVLIKLVRVLFLGFFASIFLALFTLLFLGRLELNFFNKFHFSLTELVGHNVQWCFGNALSIFKKTWISMHLLVRSTNRSILSATHWRANFLLFFTGSAVFRLQLGFIASFILKNTL